MTDLIALVDENDRITGYGEKLSVHKDGLLHRAFSVFIYDPDSRRLLLQKRASEKYHSGNLWSNSCCSHQYKDEQFLDALKRCIRDELGLMPQFNDYHVTEDSDSKMTVNTLKSKDPVQIGCFTYYSDYGEIKEHEFDHVILWCIGENEISSITPNPLEVSELRWATFDDIDNMLSKSFDSFSSWFDKAYQSVRNFMSKN